MHRLLHRGLVPLVLMTAVVLLISGCTENDAAGIGLTPVASATPAPTPIPLVENLTFKGDIAGTLTAGIDGRPLTHDNPLPDLATATDGSFIAPPPRYTQCSTFAATPGSDTIDDYLAVIVGDVGGKRYAVTVEILMDNAGYTKPGTKVTLPDNFSGSVQVYEVGGQNRQWVDTFGPSQQWSTVTLQTDRKSGTIDAWMDSAALPQNGGSPATLHLQGDWRCG
jgi:hypothetical protein